MKTFNLAASCGTVAVMLICGCATAPTGNDRPLPLKYYTKAELEDLDTVQLPSNYNVENFKKLHLAVAFNVTAKDGKLNINPDLSGRLQTEMAKLKRFTIHSMYNRNGVKAFERVADMDESVKLDKASDVENINLILNATMVISCDVHELHNEKEYVYVADCDFNCEDLKTRTVLFAEKARGVYGRKVRYSLTGQNYGSITEEVAIRSAALRALAIVANKLGNTFPAGGRVTSISGSGETMAMSAGYNEGIGAKQQVAVFLSEEGLDIPLAFAEAAPKNDGTSMLSVYKWNTDYKDARPIIKELQESPRKFLKNYKGEKKDGLYAVAFGMPVPPDWEMQSPTR